MKKTMHLILFSFFLTGNMYSMNHNPNSDTPVIGQYDTEFAGVLQTLWGEGFLSPGGTHRVDEMVEGVELDGKKVLDFGCGLGGPGQYLALKYGAQVTQLDVDQSLIDQAKQRAGKSGLGGRIQFVLISSNQLPFESEQFDVVYARESLLHIKNKPELLAELCRILKPQGKLCIYDWLHEYSSEQYSEEMKTFVLADGLTMYFATESEYRKLINDAGFDILLMKDTSQDTTQETQEDREHIAGEQGAKIKSNFGEKVLQENTESFRLQGIVFQNGEMQTWLIQAQKRNEK